MSHARGTGHRGLTSAAIAVLLLGGFASAHAALTTPACLAKKLKALGNLRRCQAIETGEMLQGKESNLPACMTKFNETLTEVDAQAKAAAIACRYGANGDGTVTDYDTGLQWEQKTSDGSIHDANNTYAWSVTLTSLAFAPPDGPAFTIFLGTLNNGVSFYANGPTSGCFAGHCDWRLPAIEEWYGRLCYGSECNIFGSPPSDGNGLWSATTESDSQDDAWLAGNDISMGKSNPQAAQAVRQAW